MCPSPSMVALYEKTPLNQVMQFPGIQAFLEIVAEAKKIHIIDLQIMLGVQWTVFMEALASQDKCLLELLKITAIGATSKHGLEDTGKRLKSFAKSMELPFSFKIVMVSDMLDLKEDLFELDAEEVVVIHA
ncbi:hypothetical protein SLE2022_164740 [Rubroshorea leprosula]